MSTTGPTIELKAEPRLCYAMQQSAVPWLRSIHLRNGAAEPLRDVTLTLEVEPPIAAPVTQRVAEIPAGGEFEWKVDPRVVPGMLANVLERVRGELRATVFAGDEVVAATTQPLEVLAYNEWPGLSPLPALLAAFCSPNHPGLAPTLHAVSDAVRGTTGSGALDGYQQKDPARVLAFLGAVHDVLEAHGITYVNPPPSFEDIGQKIRTPEQVLGDRLGTCLDLALLQAALLEHIGLHPLVVLQRSHALVGVWLQDGSTVQPAVGPAVELRKRCDLGVMAVIESVMCCRSGAQPFAVARKAARDLLDADGEFCVAIDVHASRRAGIQPLPPRTSVFTVPEPEEAVQLTPAPEPAAATDVPREVATETGGQRHESPPDAAKDRLEHWKSKLLDLTMFNRLLNFRETKKTIRLCAHDLGALEDRMQQGSRMRIYTRPGIGSGDDPRDLELAEKRSGVDVLASYLADELKSGRLRADHDGDDLEARLVKIYRHARTSLEESGANTLYLAVGFLRWFETPQSKKARRAPLLLLPLVIERTSVQEGFRLVLDDAEPRINQTLLQMLWRDFELEVTFDGVPEDERGVDVAAVLDTFRAAVLGMSGWEVELAAHIGFFSFTKYLMWLDLAEREDLMRSAALRHLVETPGATFAQDVAELARDELDDVDPEQVYCPKDADSSQLAAVLAGASGRTFVLEGPPGTGKSQTITNLIAQALAGDKRVLFVAEKRAALEVVQRRLDSVGLGAFCLELHSSKSGPKAVLEQLRRPLELGFRREPQQWGETAAELQGERRRLNRYVNSIHRRREHDISVFEAIGRLVYLSDSRRVPMPELLQRGPAEVVKAREAVADLTAAAQGLGVPREEPWWGVRRVGWSPALLRDIVGVAQRLQQASKSLTEAVRPIAVDFGLDAVLPVVGPSRDQLDLLLELAGLFRAPSLPPSALLRCGDWRATDAALSSVLTMGRKRDELWAPLAERWRRELLGLDLGTLAASYRRWAATFFVLRWWNLRKSKRELMAHALRWPGSAIAVRDDLECALQASAQQAGVDAGREAATAVGITIDGDVDWERLEAWLQWVRDARRILVKIVPGSLQPDPRLLEAVASQLDGIDNGADVLPSRLALLRAAHDEHVAASAAARDMLELDDRLAFGERDDPGCLLAIDERVRRWLQDVPRLREHCAYVRAAASVEKHGAAPLVEAHAEGGLSTNELQSAFERTFLESWLDVVYAAEPELAMFRGNDHERVIEQFCELDRRAIALAAQVISARLASGLPRLRDTQAASSELGILERELKKQRRHKPVRRLLAEIRGLLTRLAPCVLMSPLSVAQFLGRSGMRFDLVVFDEASQIPMWDAVGAIGRGESLVVVGDSRQLPPTTFFQRLEQDDDLDDDELPDDLESVLDECAAAGLPRMHLDWHYRSRHESLIAFSNHHYYQNRLLVFPAPQREVRGLGVRFVPVRGVYDRGRSQQNRIEADALVGEVMRRLRDPHHQQWSIGIVTFSRAQQVLIEDLLDRARADNAEIEPFFSAVEEPVFVKNLENVQGDERDCILFSICYGPDAAGKIYENYGPINQQGGERRLNVAVTRARRELVVFSSLRAEQVATRTAAVGARHLRVFLDYAERGDAALVAAIAADPSRDVESPFEAAVRDALVARGHEVHAQVGCSGYRIDLCIVDPAARGSYLLGIECDGATYHGGATARDRDRLRAAVLQGLGWRLHRVWSTDFWQDPDGEIERIEVALEEARIARVQVPLPEPLPEPLPAPVSEPVSESEPASAAVDAPEATDPHGPRPYVVADLDEVEASGAFHDLASRSRQVAQVEEVLTREAPIVFDRLCRTVARAWGVGRVTERVRSRLRELLPERALERDGALHLSATAAESFTGFRVPRAERDERDAEELPPVEVANAMRWLLQQHHALSAEDLAREAARVFGITRLGSVVRATMDAALERLVTAGHALRDGEAVRLPVG